MPVHTYTLTSVHIHVCEYMWMYVCVCLPHLNVRGQSLVRFLVFHVWAGSFCFFIVSARLVYLKVFGGNSCFCIPSSHRSAMLIDKCVTASDFTWILVILWQVLYILDLSTQVYYLLSTKITLCSVFLFWFVLFIVMNLFRFHFIFSSWWALRLASKH